MLKWAEPWAPAKQENPEAVEHQKKQEQLFEDVIIKTKQNHSII